MTSMNCKINSIWGEIRHGYGVELLPAFKFTGKMVKIKDFTGKW